MYSFDFDTQKRRQPTQFDHCKLQRTKSDISKQHNINLFPISCTTHLAILMQYTPLSKLLYFNDAIDEQLPIYLSTQTTDLYGKL